MLMSVLCVLAVLAIGPSKGLPCQKRLPYVRYQTFIDRHVPNNFPRSVNIQQWRRFLTASGLCGRVPTQTFIDSTPGVVDNVCGAGGWRYSQNNRGNFCVSSSRFMVYSVRSSITQNGCRVSRVIRTQNFITLACENISNLCRPVHFNGTRNRPNPANPPCP